VPQNQNAMQSPNPTSTMAIGSMYVLGAAFLFAIKGIFIKLAYQHGATPIVLLTLRMLISLPLYLLMLSRHYDSVKRLERRDLWAITALGLCAYYLASFLDLIGLQYISASLERMIIYLYPTFVVILGAMFLRRRVSIAELACLAGAYAGISLVFAHDVTFDPSTTMVHALGVDINGIVWGSVLTLGSALSFSIYIAFSESLIKRHGATVFTAISMITASAAVMLHFLLTRVPTELIQPWPVYAYATVIALFSTVAPAYLMAEGIRRVGASRAGTFATSGPVVTMIVAAILLGETVTPSHVVGIVVIIASIYSLTRIR